MQYVHVIDGAVMEGPMTLPENWRHVSNMVKLGASQLASLGWLPYYKVLPSINSVTHKAEFSHVEIGTTSVQAHYIAVAKTQDELDAEIEQGWAAVRRQRNYLLTACDWTQLADSAADKAAWATYRQILRDVPENYESPELVVWPTPPTF